MGCLKLNTFEQDTPLKKIFFLGQEPLESKRNFLKVAYTNPEVRPKKGLDYSTGGMELPGRGYNTNIYRYGMNGQEHSEEIAPGMYTAEFWEYDARIQYRWNQDPIPLADQSPYACFNNNPIWYVDVDGAFAMPPWLNNFLKKTGIKSGKSSLTPGRFNLGLGKAFAKVGSFLKDNAGTISSLAQNPGSRYHLKGVKPEFEEHDVVFTRRYTMLNTGSHGSEWRERREGDEPKPKDFGYTASHNLSKQNNILQVGFKFDHIGADDDLTVSRRNFGDDDVIFKGSPFEKETRLFDNNSIFGIDYRVTITPPDAEIIEGHAIFMAWAAVRSYKIKARLKGTKKYFEQIKKAKVIE